MTDCGETLLAVEIDVGDVSSPLLLLLVSEDVEASWPFSDDLDCALVTGVGNASVGATVASSSVGSATTVIASPGLQLLELQIRSM